MIVEVLTPFNLPGSPNPFLPRERVDLPEKDAERLIGERKAVQWPYSEQADAPASHPARRHRETATRIG